MSLILITSIFIRFAAMIWSVVLLYRVRDWRMGFMTIMLSLMALRQILTLKANAFSYRQVWLGSTTELPGLVVSVMAFLAIFFLERMLTGKKQADEMLKFTKFSVDRAVDPAFWMGPDAKFIYVNEAGCAKLGYAREELLGMTVHDIDPKFPTEAWGSRWQDLKKRGSFSIESVHQKKGGETFPVELTVNYLDYNGKEYNCAFARDITERKASEKVLADQAIRDTLTNLYNRRYFNSRVHEEIRRANRGNKSLAVLLCDLDRFKMINDTLGHHKGDEVLKETAKSIQESTRGIDLVFRWGGDEMVVVLLDSERDGILSVCDRIRTGIGNLKTKTALDIDVTIGVAVFPAHGDTMDEIMGVADRALYIAKKGGHKIHFGDEEYHPNRFSIQTVFQPVVDIRSQSFFGYEALSRDPNQNLGIQEIFKKYEAIGQIYQLKTLCFHNQLEAAQMNGLKRIFLNVDFRLLELLDMVQKPEGIEVILEISEVEALHDIPRHLSVVEKWQSEGYQFAIDDFGAGFISLPFIAQVVPDYIKIDRSTILQATTSKTFKKFSMELIGAIENFCREGIIAEGVEDEKELQVVKDLGIHLVQGYLFGQPKVLGDKPQD